VADVADEIREEDPSAEETPTAAEPLPGQPATELTAANEAATEEAGPDQVPADGPAAETGPAPRRPRLLTVLGAAIVVLAAFGVWATIAGHGLRASATAQNTALADRPASAEVTRQVSEAVATIFSYDYADTARTKQAAQTLLTGRAIKQYDSLFALVERQAPQQKLIVTTRVTNTGVEYLTGDRARVLVFANQQDTRAGTHQSSYAGTMFAVTAVRSGTRWKIENIDTFNAPSG
jgi:Mce-associated membrane protein